MLPDFFFCSLSPVYLADHGRDWPPCVCVVIRFILDVRFVDVPAGVPLTRGCSEGLGAF